MMKVLLLCAALMMAGAMFAQDKGYEKSIELSGSFGVNKYAKYALSASMINGYRINPHFFIGAGVGFKYFDVLYYSSYISSDYTDTFKHTSYDGKYLIPLWARFKANFTDTKISPYAILDAGWTFDVGQNPNKNTEGFFIEPQLGLDVKMQEKIGLYFAVGVNLQNYHYQYISNHSDLDGDKNMMLGTISIHAGIKF